VTLGENHIEVLNHVPLNGGTRESLGELLQRPEFQELVAAGYIEYRPTMGSEPTRPGGSGEVEQDAWYLTPAGATAINVDSERIAKAHISEPRTTRSRVLDDS
jgi:hypothetical protein